MPPQEPKVRVFISHSANSEEVQKGLVAALEEPARGDRFKPLLDQIELRPGDMWRARINLWAGGCDAAVVLLSEAALKSDWVFYEASLLSYRCQANSSFLVIPVCLGTVDQTTFEASRFHRVLQLANVQAVHGAGKPAGDVVTKIVQRLEEKAVYIADTPARERARHLLKELAAFGEDQLQEAARRLRLELDPWMPDADARLRVAVQLMSVGMEASVGAIAYLHENLPPSVPQKDRAHWLKQVLDLVASAWVDDKAAGRIRPIALRQQGWTALGINARDPQTVRMYVLSASRNQSPPWRHVVFCDTTRAVGDTIEEIVRKLETSVEEALLSTVFRGSSRKDLPRLLRNRYFGDPHPVFLALQGDGITNEILAALRTRFEHVTFFLLMGETPMEDLQEITQEVLEILFPQLVPPDEDRFLETYESFQDRFFSEISETQP